MTEQNDNVVNVRFKPLTSVEEYIKNLDEIKPDDILSLVVKDGEVFIISTEMIDPMNITLVSLHMPIVHDFLLDLYYAGISEEIDE